jgi:hypothetical protein
MIEAGDKLRFRQGDVILTGLAAGPEEAGQVTVETLEDPPRTFVRSAGEVVVIGSESVFVRGAGLGPASTVF